ncbi:hypothetical protein OF83DRAFT_622196 [Amylostereum chailletii]|nr:hypothetical protein OF83DRAFT_622196 [Amylostereum chailletii]
MKLNGVNIILYAALLRLSRPILSAPPSIAQDAGVPAGGSAGGGKDAITSRSSSIDANLANIVDPCSNLTRLNGISPYQVQEAVPEVDITGGIRGKDEDATSFEVVSDVIQGASQQCCPKSSTEESVYAMLYKAACIFSVIFHILYIAQRIFGSPFRTRPSNDSSGTDGLSDALDSTSIIVRLNAHRSSFSLSFISPLFALFT